MRLLDFPHTAYKISEAAHTLYDGNTGATLTLTGTLPSVSFRCQVRLYTATGRTDCAGTVTIGTETLTFIQASKKVTSTLLSALPTITTSGLTCQIEILAVDTAGKVIMDDTSTAIKVRFEPTTKSYQNNEGEWKQCSAYAMVVDSTITTDYEISYAGTVYEVAQVESLIWLDGTELYRILYFA